MEDLGKDVNIIITQRNWRSVSLNGLEPINPESYSGRHLSLVYHRRSGPECHWDMMVTECNFLTNIPDHGASDFENEGVS